MIKIFSKENIIILFKTLFPNKKTLDKLAESEDGSNLLFNGEKILSGADNVYDYIDKESGLEDTPIGSVISYIGITAPKHYLICDGAVYSITDYQKLADQIKKETGSYNYYGGDGITTFAVPDMRGEFVRGCDPTAIRDPNGATRGVGKHQDATYIKNSYCNYANFGGFYSDATGVASPLFSDYITNNSNIDSVLTKTKGLRFSSGTLSNASSWVDLPAIYTARPTNVNVLFCIKYEPTYFMNVSYGGFSKKVLFSGDSGNTVGQLHTLTDRLINYDFLTISIQWTKSGPAVTTYYVDVDEIVEMIKLYPNDNHYLLNPHDTFFFYINFKSDYITWSISARNVSSVPSPYCIAKIVGYAGASTDSITDEQINTEIEELWKEDSI